MEEVIEKYEPIVATPLKKGEIAPVLDEEGYNTLRDMINSSDEGNHKMAQLILNTCDIQKSIYWIWKLSRHGWGVHRMVNLRTKASRAFRNKSNLFSISSKGSLPFIEFLDRQGWLTPEIYKREEETIIDLATRQFDHRFYTVEFTIKDEYKHLPKITTPISKDDE